MTDDPCCVEELDNLLAFMLDLSDKSGSVI